MTRVEEAVDRFLYWDEEVTIIEAVTSVSCVDLVVKSCDQSCDISAQIRVLLLRMHQLKTARMWCLMIRVFLTSLAAVTIATVMATPRVAVM